MAPFLAYLPAEELHASGVIAVVTAGLILGHKAPIIQDATSRLNERINWETIQFLLENSVFLLIGLQVRQHPGRRRPSRTCRRWTIAVFCVGVLVAVILVRPLWVFPVGYFLVRPRGGTGPGPYSWRATAVHLLGGHARGGHPGRRLRAARDRAQRADPGARRVRGHRRHPADPGSVPAVAGPPAADPRARRPGGRAGRGHRADVRRSRPAAPNSTGSPPPRTTRRWSGSCGPAANRG